MKILHTLDSLNRGGTESLVLDVCRNALRNGIDLTFVATGSGSLESEFESAPVKYFRLRRKHPIDLNLVLELRKIIKESGVSIVHGHQPVEALHLYLASRGLNGVKCVMSHHGGGTFFQGNSLKNTIGSKVLYKIVDANIACSNDLLKSLVQKFGADASKNFRVVYNGVDSARLEIRNPTLRDEIGIDEGTILMGMVGNFLPPGTKDQMTICKALPSVIRKHPGIHFVFAGAALHGGEDYFHDCRDYCRKAGISESVSFLGSRTDIPNVLNSLDIFVFSTLHEGLPIALTEAILIGIPSVVSEIGPNLEVTNNGSAAELFKPGDHEDLADKLLKLLDDRKLRDRYSSSATEFAGKNLTIDAHLNSLKNLYEEILSRDIA